MLKGSKKENIVFFSLLGLYLFWVYFFIGFRSDHAILVGVLSLLFVAHPTSQKLVFAFGLFILYWVIFDSLRVYPNYLIQRVHIQDLYLLEKAWFGLQSPNGTITLNEYFGIHHHPILDLITGIAYLFWVPAPILFTLYCFFRYKEITLKYWMAFFVANIFGFIGYYLYPAAPPWYYELYGDQFIAQTASNAARLIRVDQFIGIPIFENLYSKGSAVFAAIPSMHSAFPVLLIFYSLKIGKHWLTLLFLCLTLSIWLGAVYLNHHYVIDVLLGIIIAAVTLFVLEKWLFKSILKKHMDRMLKRIS